MPNPSSHFLRYIDELETSIQKSALDIAEHCYNNRCIQITIDVNPNKGCTTMSVKNTIREFKVNDK